jgi:hypothetical protein
MDQSLRGVGVMNNDQPTPPERLRQLSPATILRQLSQTPDLLGPSQASRFGEVKTPQEIESGKNHEAG